MGKLYKRQAQQKQKSVPNKLEFEACTIFFNRLWSLGLPHNGCLSCIFMNYLIQFLPKISEAWPLLSSQIVDEKL